MIVLTELYSSNRKKQTETKTKKQIKTKMGKVFSDLMQRSEINFKHTDTRAHVHTHTHK